MGLIHILSENIVNRIAAGEVIERPASIMKELIENSLDAGAKSIEIEVRHGGKSLIRISDDGCGMNAEDAERAFQRYATSKISKVEDLEDIASYGFRGEALPSIASVSRTHLTTRLENASIGTELKIEGGKLLGAKEAPCRKGTIIEVRDLFFNTPARRKFLKADATEMGHVMDVITNMSFARLDVRFQVTSSGRTLLDLFSTDSLKQRARSVLGEETAKSLLDLDAEKDGMRVWGVIGKPRIARANRHGQSFFINGRLVKFFGLSHALQAGYHGLLMHGQFPVTVLFVEVDPHRLDVNVHPTKQEVRISNENQIKSFVKGVVASRLAQEQDLAPDLSFRQQDVNHAGPAPWTPFVTRGGMVTGTEDSHRELHLSEAGRALKVEPALPVSQEVAAKNRFKVTKILGQIHHTFILAETQEGLLIVDQHAAHERVHFEALVKGFRSGNPVKQKLLMDEIIEVSFREAELLRKSLPFLTKMGFEIDEFGEKTFVVRSLPAVFGSEHAEAIIKGYLEEIDEGKVRTGLEDREEEVAALIACKRKSVRAHDSLHQEQILALFEQLDQCDNPFSCPHGRPTFLKQTFLDLEKQFRRK